MQNDPTVFVTNNEEGKNMVTRFKGKYAFFCETTVIKFYTHRDYSLFQVGEKLDTKEYGIGMPMSELKTSNLLFLFFAFFNYVKWLKQTNSRYLLFIDSHYREDINKIIIKLKEGGEMRDMYKKWWEPEFNEKGEKYADDEKKDDKDGTKPMGMDTVGGVFIVLIVGIAISLFLGFVEFLWAVRQTSIKFKVIWFILSQKIVNKPKSMCIKTIQSKFNFKIDNTKWGLQKRNSFQHKGMETS